LSEFKLGENYPRASAACETCSRSLGQILKSQ